VSPRGAPIILIQKKDGSWKTLCGLPSLNKATCRNPYPFPSIDNLLDQMKGATMYSILIGDQVITSYKLKRTVFLIPLSKHGSDPTSLSFGRGDEQKPRGNLELDERGVS
jgi:hypothetical protein